MLVGYILLPICLSRPALVPHSLLSVPLWVLPQVTSRGPACSFWFPFGGARVAGSTLHVFLGSSLSTSSMPLELVARGCSGWHPLLERHSPGPGLTEGFNHADFLVGRALGPLVKVSPHERSSFVSLNGTFRSHKALSMPSLSHLYEYSCPSAETLHVCASTSCNPLEQEQNVLFSRMGVT